MGTLLQINPSSVVKWVNEGLLPAYRTPGGHRRIRRADLVSFLRGNGMFIPPELGGGVTRVLMVDDDVRLLSAFARAMRAHADRIELEVVQSGIEALVKVGAAKPDVLIIDIHMPEVDGFEVCRRLKEKPETEHIDVLMMTGKPKSGLEEHAREVGARALLIKPLLASQLVELLFGSLRRAG